MSTSLQAGLSGTQPINYQRVAGSTTRSSRNSPQAEKLRNATAEFESILVTSWWEQMEKSYGGSEQHEVGYETYRDMGLRAVTMAMAKAGGLGIGRMLYHQLEPALSRDESQTQRSRF